MTRIEADKINTEFLETASDELFNAHDQRKIAKEEGE
jgi:hypothetical protein